MDRLPQGARLIPIIFASDVTFLINFSEDKKAWLIYMTIGNILLRTMNKASKNTTVLLALLPIAPKMLGVVTRDAPQMQVKNESHCDLIKEIFAPIVSLKNCGLKVAYANRTVQLCFPSLSDWIADDLENVTLHDIQERSVRCL